MIRTIQLHGSLAEKFTKEPFELDVDSPTLLLRGLSCIFPTFEQELKKNAEYQIVKVEHEKKCYSYIDIEKFGVGLGDSTEIHIAPVIEGRGLEIAAALVAKGTAAYFIIGFAINIGVSMLMSYVAQRLSPSAKTTGASTPAADRPSFMYNGVITNVVTPGNAKPLVYGRAKVGSYVISTGAVSERT